jgi:NADH:ubiquinone oxidoreductase subunit E
MDRNAIDALVKQVGTDDSSLVAILQEVQRKEGHLPQRTLGRLAERLSLPLSRLYALATFYRSFTLAPTGRHKVCVCLGTACHVRGAQGILGRLEGLLGVRAGETTADRRFTLETVRCIGCCSIGPVARVGTETFGRLRQDKVAKLLEPFR